MKDIKLKNPNQMQSKNKTENFLWTDDKVEHLLNVILEYKVKRTAENVDWESCIGNRLGIDWESCITNRVILRHFA